MIVIKLLSEHHLEFLRLKGDCSGLSESTLVKLTHCWKSHALAHMIQIRGLFLSNSPYQRFENEFQWTVLISTHTLF